MEQHPVPQHIASYEFRLIGDMTLKQFAQLAAGAILGLIIYALPMPSIFKWPFIVFFGFSGFAFQAIGKFCCCSIWRDYLP